MKRLVLFIEFCFVLCHYGGKTVGLFAISDMGKNISELITTYGYPYEDYTVQTTDGYLLSLQRIPHGRNGSMKGGKKKVVLLIHGELGDAKTWFLNPPGQSLGYILPDKGFDVWLFNKRGCNYSKRNVKYTTNENKFWDYSFDEVAKYDVPNTIDYVLNATGKLSLYLIGYSSGNTAFMAMLSEFPDYNPKVKVGIALAPVAYVGNFTTAVRFFIPFAEEIVLAVNLVSHGEFPPYTDITKEFIAKFCAVNLDFCEKVIYAIAGEDKANLNKTRIPYYARQYISSTSTKTLYHFGQLYRSGKFRKFDYGLADNLIVYGQTTPPDYQLSRITAPIALISGQNDIIADPKDVDIIRNEINSVDDDEQVDHYNHFDPVLGENAPELVYGHIVQLLNKY